VKHDIENMTQTMDVKRLEKVCKKIVESIRSGSKVYSTGIGSSEAHSRAL
jgi:phosphoheptose isomerase